MLPFAVFPPALLALGLLTRNISAQENRNLSDHSVGPFPVFSKIPPIGAADPYIIETFTQKLSLYCIAIDTKNFSALSGVFTHNVVANVAPSPITSLAEYETFLEADLRGFKTQHTSDTVFVYNIEPYSAQSTSYSAANRFGQGALLGQVLTYFEKFDDVWSKDKVTRSWKISERKVRILSVAGNLSVFPPGAKAVFVELGLLPP